MSTQPAIIPQLTEVKRPTPEEIDELAERYHAAKSRKDSATSEFQTVEQEATEMVTQWGIVVPRAEKSRRLQGKLAILTVTKSDTLTIDDDRVETLKDALEVNGYGEFFKKLFAPRVKYEVVKGAEEALKAESLPKRLSEKVLNLWGRCIGVKPKKPALSVKTLDPAKPAKRAKKARA